MLYAIIIHTLSGLFIVNKNASIITKVLLSGTIVVVIMWVASANTFLMEDYKDKKIVKYDKIEFIDSTEKIIVYSSSPIDETIIFDKMSTNIYYSIRNVNDINITINYVPCSDYYDKQKDIISEHRYFYSIRYSSETYKTLSFEKQEQIF